MLSKGRCSGRMQKGAGELGKAVRNRTQLVNSIGKSRWELRRGAGSGWCNLGDGDKEPEAEGAQCRGGRRLSTGRGTSQRGSAGRGGSSFPKLDGGPRNGARGGPGGAQSGFAENPCQRGEQEGEAGETAGERIELGG